jgi:hypothetical protein
VTARPVRASSAQRPTSATRTGVTSAGRAAGSDIAAKSAIHSYLRIFNLGQYARAFLEVGLTELEAIARLTEGGALELLERLRVYPGHRLRLLRAMDVLRNAVLSQEIQEAAQLLEEKLCAENKEMQQEKEEATDQNRRLQAENESLVAQIRQQDASLQKARGRVKELEDMVQGQTEQVSFLAQQLQAIAERGGPKKQEELFKSYRESVDLDKDDDWAAAKKIQLPGPEDVGTIDGESLLRLQIANQLNADFPGGTSPTLPQARGGARPEKTAAPQPQAMQTTFPPQPSRLAQTLDSAKVKECLVGFDVDHIVQCLATAIQNKIILSTAKRRPHQATKDCLSACAIFLEDSSRKKLLQPGAPSDLLQQGSDLSSSLSFCSALMSRASPGATLVDSLGKPVDPLNDVAVRTVPGKWDIYNFLRDVMLGFRLQPEVSVVTLFYLDRFSEKSGVAMTPDNWQRLTIAAMMLASKVWDDESFENAEFAQLCPLYTIDEINTFERVFLKSVGYCMACKGSEYAKTYFTLRTLGAKDNPDFALQPLDQVRASRLTERCLEKQVEFRERYLDAESNMNWTM